MCLICSIWFTMSQWLQLGATRHKHILHARRSQNAAAWGHHCVGSVLVLHRWAPSRQGNSLCLWSLLPHSTIQRRHDERGNNEINRLDELGNTSHRRCRRAADVFGGPWWHDVASGGEDHRWWSTYKSWVGRQREHWAALTLMRVSTPVCPRAAKFSVSV